MRLKLMALMTIAVFGYAAQAPAAQVAKWKTDRRWRIPGSTGEHAPVLARDILGANIKMILGYKGTADVRLAIDSGEVEGLFNSYTSLQITSLDKIKSGEWVVLAQLSEKPAKKSISCL